VRIAVYHDLPSGGGKRALHEMVRRLSARHELDVFTLSCAEHEFGDLRPYASRHTVYRFEPLPLLSSPFGRANQLVRAADLARLRRVECGVANAIDRLQYDVLFAHNCQFGQSPGELRFVETRSVYYCQEPPRLCTSRPYHGRTSLAPDPGPWLTASTHSPVYIAGSCSVTIASMSLQPT
jgi:hypothetical protein